MNRTIPAAFDRLLQECLEKDPDRRWHSAHDAARQMVAISDGVSSNAEVRGVSGRRWMGWAAAAVATAVAVSAIVWGRGTPSQPERLESEIAPPPETTFIYNSETVHFAVSPNGRQLAFITSAPGTTRIWMRELSSIQARPVAGTDGASVVFWSPDSRSIAFVVGDTLKRLELASGAAVTICKVPSQIGLSGTWSDAGQILFASVEGDAIRGVAAGGGDATLVVKPDVARSEVRVAFPSFLPGSDRYLYLARRHDGSNVLMLGEIGQAARVVMPIESNAQYVEPGTLVFARGGALVGQSFDAAANRLTGQPFAIADSVRFFLSTSVADFSTSPNGALVFQSHANRSRLAWIDRSGRELGVVGSRGDYLELRLTPSGKTVLASRRLPTTGTYDIWSFDLDRGTETRVTLEDAFTEIEGTMVPGGDVMVYAAARGTPPTLRRRDLRTGQDALLLPQGLRLQGPDDVTPDGRVLAYEERTENGTFNLWTLPLSGPAAPTVIRRSPFTEAGLRFSPDSDHYTFVSTESGRPEVYLSRLSGGSKAIVSTGGGFASRWSRTGREIFYMSADLRMMVVPVRTTPALELGTPSPLFAISTRRWVNYDVSPDGNRFLAIVPETVANEQPLTAIRHWNSTRDN